MLRYSVLYFFSLLLIASSLASCQTVEADPIPWPGPQITYSDGTVEGYHVNGINQWKGLPFAAPPVNHNRLKPPQPNLPWTGVRNAYSNGNICPQFHLAGNLYLGDEDCLYLDVYAPEGASADNPLPVFVWIFGGGYSIGDGTEFGLYDANNIARKRNMVVVTFNYRLGPLGFLALDELRSDNAEGTVGNWALLDQVAALKWVQKNIQAFGGDPNKVTIAGESAGAFSVCWHLVSPSSRGLFHNAIMESGTCDSHQFFRNYNNSISWSKTFTTMVGCNPEDSKNVLTCLRDLPTATIMGNLLSATQISAAASVNRTEQEQEYIALLLQQQQQYFSQVGAFIPQLYPVMPWGPTIDFVALLDRPLNLIQTGNWNAVPLVIGTNQDEGTIFAPMLQFVLPGKVTYPIQKDQIPIIFQHFFGNNETLIAKVLDFYPLYAYDNNPNTLTADVLRDFFFVCATRRVLNAITNQGYPAWMYHFTYKGDWIEDPFFGVYHSAELEYVWDNQWPPLVHIFSANDQTIADTFGTYWGNLVHFQTPNGNSSTGPAAPAIYWPAYNTTTRTNLIIQVQPTIEVDLLEEQCQFWDQVVPYLAP